MNTTMTTALATMSITNNTPPTPPLSFNLADRLVGRLEKRMDTRSMMMDTVKPKRKATAVVTADKDKTTHSVSENPKQLQAIISWTMQCASTYTGVSNVTSAVTLPLTSSHMTTANANSTNIVSSMGASSDRVRTVGNPMGSSPPPQCHPYHTTSASSNIYISSEPSNTGSPLCLHHHDISRPNTLNWTHSSHSNF